MFLSRRYFVVRLIGGYWWGWKCLASHSVVDVRFCPGHFVVGVRFSATHFVVRLWSVDISSYAFLRAPSFCSSLSCARHFCSGLKKMQTEGFCCTWNPTQRLPDYILQNGVPGWDHYKMTCTSKCNERMCKMWCGYFWIYMDLYGFMIFMGFYGFLWSKTFNWLPSFGEQGFHWGMCTLIL